jgi:hypothetical protein
LLEGDTHQKAPLFAFIWHFFDPPGNIVAEQQLVAFFDSRNNIAQDFLCGVGGNEAIGG